MEDAILIKVLGKLWYYPQLVAKLDILWGLHGDAEMLDLENNFYYIKAMSDKKCEMILTESPWQLAGSFLSIRKWIPGFRADNDKVETAITWVWILNLPIELFRESIIQTIVECVGDSLKIVGNTFSAPRGKFAHFCVEIKIGAPPELGVCINGAIYQVVYENLPTVCYACERAGHHSSSCWKRH